MRGRTGPAKKIEDRIDTHTVVPCTRGHVTLDLERGHEAPSPFIVRVVET